MPNICVLSIGVTDMHEAKEFYCNKLGFKISKEYCEDIISIENNNFPLILQKVEKNTSSDYPKEAQVIFALQTNDLIKTIQEYKEKDIEVLFDTPQKCPPGYYTAFKDPFGNIIELLEFE